MKKYLFLGLLFFSVFSFAQCNISDGFYDIHSYAKKYGIGNIDELKNGLEVFGDRSKIINIETKEQFKLLPLNEEMQSLLEFVQNKYLRPVNKSGKKVACSYLLADGTHDQQDAIMLVELDMSEVMLISDEQLGAVRRIFFADFPTEVENPKRWTRREIKKFRYFYVWTFSIPSVTAGAIFVPLEYHKPSKK